MTALLDLWLSLVSPGSRHQVRARRTARRSIRRELRRWTR